MLPTPPDRSPPSPPPARQLALPLGLVAAPPLLPPLGPPVPPRRVWQSLALPVQAAVRRALARVCEEACPPHAYLKVPEKEVAREPAPPAARP